ncbi:MAG: long-chain fatty acid--CoA ligase [Gemmatimonadota bacterium]
MRDVEWRALRATLMDLFSRPLSEPLEDSAFNRIALRVFAYQYERNAPYSAYCHRRDRTPASTGHWTQIPPVPTAAFREVALAAGDPADAEAVFRTSGTTGGDERRGTHHVLDVSIYHFALIPNFAACLLPDGAELTMLSLVPPKADMPDSSLAHMVAVVLERLGATDSAYCATASHGIDDAAFDRRLRTAEDLATPICILGTSFAFVHWLDRVAARGDRYALPVGSRLMDTGGYKGRSREVDEEELRGLYRELIGIPASHCVNEYGMTEMCSQFYDSSLRDAIRGRGGDRRKLVPPWVRTRVVDPESLEPVPDGAVGLLQHFDLANAGSVSAIQTEDLGVVVDDGFRLLGRAPDAVPRGCSVAMDLLLEAVDSRKS